MVDKVSSDMCDIPRKDRMKGNVNTRKVDKKNKKRDEEPVPRDVDGPSQNYDVRRRKVDENA